VQQRHVRDFAAIRNLICERRRLGVEGRKEMRELRAEQKKTTPSLKALIAERRLKYNQGVTLTVNQRLDKHDREIAAIRKMIHEGMRLIVEEGRKAAEYGAQFRKDMLELTRNVNSLVRTMRGSPNGHGKRRIDLH
jgi:hypothetical protein